MTVILQRSLVVREQYLCRGTRAVECPSVNVLANPCGTYGCLITTGECGFLPVADGTACDDNNPCSLSDHCSSGACVGGPVIQCDDKSMTDTCENGACSTQPMTEKSAMMESLHRHELCSGGVCGSPTSTVSANLMQTVMVMTTATCVTVRFRALMENAELTLGRYLSAEVKRGHARWQVAIPLTAVS